MSASNGFGDRRWWAALTALCVATLLWSIPYGGTAVADATTPTTNALPAPHLRVGARQRILGPSGNVDSLFVTVRDSKGLHALMSNDTLTWYDVRKDGSLIQPGRVVLTDGGKGSVDQCGVHPVGPIYKATARHWITFYHAERANPDQDGGNCSAGPGLRNYTRWSVVEMHTYDGGRTWHKGKQVLTQDRKFLHYQDPSTFPAKGDDLTDPKYADLNLDDVGSPRMLIGSKYLYLFYRAINRNSDDQMEMSVARVRKSAANDPSAWHKYCVTAACRAADPSNKHKGWGQPGRGGQQGSIPGLPSTARGITWNGYLHRYLSVLATPSGIQLYVSQTGRSAFNRTWRPYATEPIVGRFGAGGAFGEPCVAGRDIVTHKKFPVAVGYGATIGWSGSSAETGKYFWVYYMVKPKGYCFNHRVLYRRGVSLSGPVPAYPTRSYTVALSAPKLTLAKHHWTATTTLTRDNRAWAKRKVTVQHRVNHHWRVLRHIRSNAKGRVVWHGHPKGKYRFFIPKSGKHHAAHSKAFKTPKLR